MSNGSEKQQLLCRNNLHNQVCLKLEQNKTAMSLFILKSGGIMRGDVLDKKGVGRFLLVHATLLCSCSQINSRLTLKEDRLPAGRTAGRTIDNNALD